ncbi:hypothetical protein D3C71_1820810 [compost metagenome]
MQIGVADPAGADLDQHLAGAGTGDGQMLDRQRYPEAMRDRRSHGALHRMLHVVSRPGL